MCRLDRRRAEVKPSSPSALVKLSIDGVNSAKFALPEFPHRCDALSTLAVAMVTVQDRNCLYKFKIKMKLWILSGFFDVYLPSVVAL